MKKCESFHEEKETKTETSAEPARKRKKPAYLADFVVSEKDIEKIDAPTSSEQKCTSDTELFRQYCEILDCLIKSIGTRFDQTDIGVLRKVERLILDAYNEDHLSTDDIEQLQGSYGKFWFQTNLKEEL